MSDSHEAVVARGAHHSVLHSYTEAEAQRKEQAEKGAAAAVAAARAAAAEGVPPIELDTMHDKENHAGQKGKAGAHHNGKHKAVHHGKHKHTHHGKHKHKHQDKNRHAKKTAVVPVAASSIQSPQELRPNLFKEVS